MVEVVRYKPRVVTRAGPVVPVQAPESAAGDLAAGLADVGDMFADWQDEIDTARAKEAEASYTEQLNDLLYNEQSGYMHTQGGTAVEQYGRVSERANALYEEILGGLDGGARTKAAMALRARRNSTLTNVNRHAATSRIGYLNQAATARVEASINTAIYDPGQVAREISIVSQELRDMGVREGWAPEVLAEKQQDAVDAIHRGVVERMMNADPLQAMGYLARNREQISGATLADLEAELMPIAQEYRGRELGRLATQGRPVLNANHGTQIDFELTGKARPNPPAQDLQNLLGTAAAQVFGEGARVVIFSGREDEGRQHGSNRHGTGLAADIRVYDANGSLVALSDARAKDFLLTAARLGARGIGAGAEYMGDAFHIDMVPHEDYTAGQGPVWGSFSASFSAEIIKAMGEGAPVTLSDILNEPDSRVRDEGLREYALRTETAAAEREAALKAVGNQVFQHLEAGGRLDDIPGTTRQSLGQKQMTALRAYERSIANGVPVETDPETYLELRRILAEDPQGFRRLDLIPYVDRLSTSDWRSFAEKQTTPLSDIEARATSTLMATAKRSLEAAGVDTTPKPGTADARTIATFQSDLTRWQDQFIAQQGRTPTPTELDAQIGMMLREVVIDSSYWPFSAETNKVFQVDLDGRPLDESDDMSLEDFMSSSIDINGIRVPIEMKEAIVRAFQRQYARDPTAQEIFDELVNSPYFQ